MLRKTRSVCRRCISERSGLTMKEHMRLLTCSETISALQQTLLRFRRRSNCGFANTDSLQKLCIACYNNFMAYAITNSRGSRLMGSHRLCMAGWWWCMNNHLAKGQIVSDYSAYLCGEANHQLGECLSILSINPIIFALLFKWSAGLPKATPPNKVHTAFWNVFAIIWICDRYQRARLRLHVLACPST